MPLLNEAFAAYRLVAAPSPLPPPPRVGEGRRNGVAV